MSSDPRSAQDQLVLDMIEHSPTGAVPHTPTHQDALRRLYATHQVYSSADYKDGHVTARSLSTRPAFHADNLHVLLEGGVGFAGLEADGAIFDRYVASLPEGMRAKAESFRATVLGRRILHRKHAGEGESSSAHDPSHSLFLVPGSGPRLGLPGNYLHGSVMEVVGEGGLVRWAVQLHDAADGGAAIEVTHLAEALGKLEELLAIAPFHLSELAALDFEMR